MKKLKQMSGPYSIGFELSSTAHGFVATDPNGNVLYHGKQPVMGTRVFKEGQHAAEARMPRTSRRGIQRRRGREHEMERVFAPVISSIDPDFFIRRRMSYKLGKIRFESDPIGFSYSRLFHSFQTLAHLDVALMEADSAMDPRLIFEAVANHVVRRGHFLLENQNVSSTNSDIDTQVANYAEVLVSYFEDTLDERIELSLEALDINGNVTARELQKQFASAMCVSGDDIQKKTEKAQIKAIADLVAGYKADLTVLVPDAEKLPKVSISDGDALEEFLADSCPDSLVPVLMAAQALYTSWKLQGMLSYAPGKSLSHNQVAQHDVYGKGTFVIPGLQRVDTLALGAVQVQLSTENEIPTQDAILIHACAVANFQIGQTPELIEIASKNYLNMDKAEMTRQVTEVMLGKMREVIGQMDLKELMRDRESFNHKVFEGSRDDLANLGLELRTFNVQDFSDSQGIIRSMGADQAAEIKKEAELAQIRAEQEVAERQNQLDLKKAELKKTADKAAAEADMVKQTVTAEKQRELYVAQQEAQIAAETKKVELAERQVAVKERELDATVRKQAEADRYAAEQKADAELYTRTKNAEAAKVEAQNKSDADLYSAQKTAEGVSAKAKAEAEATRLKGEADGAAEKAHGEGVAAGIKAQTEAYNGMENAYLLANRYIDVMPEVAEAVAKPLTAVDSIKMYGDGNATKLVHDTTGMVDQVTSGLKDATGIDLTELLSSFHQPFQPREDNE